MLVELPLTCVLHHVWEKFLGVFTHAPVLHAKLQGECFENLYPLTIKGVEKTMICFIKSQSENIKIT